MPAAVHTLIDAQADCVTTQLLPIHLLLYLTLIQFYMKPTLIQESSKEYQLVTMQQKLWCYRGIQETTQDDFPLLFDA